MYAIYARQSVDRMDSTSIEDQIEFCKNQIKQHIALTEGPKASGALSALNKLDDSMYKEYSDKGYSGKNTNRPAFEEMIGDIEQGGINSVVVYKLDRISRSVLDFSKMWDKFEKYKVEFISCHEKFDTTNPTGRAMLQICIVFAQLERETIQQRVTDTYYSRSRAGFYMGGRVLYGFSLEETHIGGKKTSRYVLNPEEGEHIKLLYSMYSKPGTSLGDIVRYLRDNNLRHLRGAVWSTAKISELLRNPSFVKADIDVYNFYKAQGANVINDASDFIGENGCYLYNIKGDGSNKKQYDLTGRDLVLAPHEGIVTSDIWLKCRIKCINNRQSATTCKGKNTWLVGKLKCGRCGRALTIRKSQTKAGRYFVCSSVSLSKNCGGAGTLYAGEIENMLSGEIRNKLKGFTSLSQEERKVDPRINKLKIKLAQLDKEIDNLVNRAEHADGLLFKRINEKVGSLDSERKDLEAELLLLTDTINDMSRIDNFVDEWDITCFEDRQLVVDALVRVVYIADGAIEIAWRI